MRPTIKHFASCLALTMAFFATLTSCSKEDVAGDQLPDGKYPVNLTATMEGVATRAISDNAWEGGEEVAVRIGNEVKKYTVTNAANGTLTAHSDNEPFYWQSTTETKSISAWSPFSVVKPTSFSVEADQSAEGYQASDLIYTLQTVTYINNSITFRHLPAKVVVHLKAGLGITQAEVQNATVTVLNQNLTSGTIADDWSVAQQTAAGSDAITPNVLTTPTTDYQKTVQALLVPQTIAAGARMLQVSIGGGLFYYTPIAEQSLAAGNQYNYQITVNATGLTVTTLISDWTTEEVTGDAEMEGVPFGSKSASQAAIGDFYFSDGSLEDKDATLTAEQKMACIGIVLKVGRDVDGEWKDDCDYKLKDGVSPMSTICGYVLGLHHAFDTENVRSRSLWSTKTESITSMREEDYTFFNGYSLTQNIISYANTNGWQLKTSFPALYWSTVAYEADKGKAPERSSGWFMPSAGQCLYWCHNKDIILNSFKKVTSNDVLKWEGGYWSSTEVASNNAVFVHFEDDIMYSAPKNNRIYIRPVFAF